MTRLPTLADVRNLFQEIDEMINAFGAPPGFENTYATLSDKLEKAIAKDCRIPINNLNKLPPETLLGKESSGSFARIQSWYKNSQSSFYPSSRVRK